MSIATPRYFIRKEMEKSGVSFVLPEQFSYEPYCSSKNGKDIDYYFFLVDKQAKPITLYQLTIILEDKFLFKLNKDSYTPIEASVGQLFLYDEMICSIEKDKNKKSTITFFNKNLAFSKNRKLRYAREKPFVHVMCGEIYCMGGQKDKEPLIEVRVFTKLCQS